MADAMPPSKLPPSSNLEAPLLTALRESREAMTTSAINAFVARELESPDGLPAALRAPWRGSRTEFAYRMAWARTGLKGKGLVERAESKTWRLSRGGAPR
jgi:Mrr N-terminal domain